MKIPFTKMHWLWNDFVILDMTWWKLNELKFDYHFIAKMWDRNFGIGFDQLLLIKDSQYYDFEYVIYNNDWSQVQMCGNWVRCFTKYVVERWLTTKHNLQVLTKWWVIKPQYLWDMIKVDMWKPILERSKIPVSKTSNIIQIDDERVRFIPVSMGNPHAVVFIDDDLNNYPVEKNGKIIENSMDYFPQKTNVEFVKVKDNKYIQMRVWERWAWETLACWTWACASVVAWILEWKLLGWIDIKVELLWWNLIINWSWNKDESIFMSWPASFVFDWEYYLDNE